MGVGSNVLSTCKRKEVRGRVKKLKKMQKAAYAARKKVEDVVVEKFASEDKQKPKKKKRKKRKRNKSQSARDSDDEVVPEKKVKTPKKENVRKLELVRALKEDEAEIKRLSKKLGYSKRKNKNLPQIFTTEGLDYILDMCDMKKRKATLSDSENDDVPELEKDLESGGELFSDEEEEEEMNEASSSQDNVEMEQEDEKVSDKEEEIKEDIYGRTIDKKTGTIIPSNAGAHHKLEELERRTNVAGSEERMKLERTIRGIFNRLNENTIVNSVKTMKDLFMSHGHNDVKQFLYECLHNCVSVGFRLPDRIVIEYALFIALLHTTVSTDLSSHFVEHFILQYLKVAEAPADDKALENMSILLAELFNFKVIRVVIISELFGRLIRAASDKTLECAKLLISYSGTLLKKRDFEALQTCITDAQQLLAQLSDESLKQQHFRFISEEFMDIKNGNIRRWTDAIDFSLFEHYMSIYRGLTKKTEKEDELGMSVDDIVHVAERGRWWLVGSAWMPSAKNIEPTQGPSTAGQKPKVDDSLLELARKAKMNTAVRRDVFCALVSSKSELDAFEKLVKLSLKGQQEREIIHICIHCALQETVYNPFYTAVIDQFCSFHKRFKLTTQYALWDRLKNLAKFAKWQQSNFATLTADLIVKRSASLTVLKVIEFGAIDALTTQYLRRVLRKVLLDCNEGALREIFEGVVTSPAQKLFSQGLQIFVHMTMKKMNNETVLSRIDFLDSIWGDDRL